MSNSIICVENIGKRYRLGTRHGPYKRLTETIADLFSVRQLQNLRKQDPQDAYLWALRNVSFEVMAGEVLGVIGRNGAGKSTLLKILSRITEPSEGEAKIKGRVGSLLEVGTGFHPELTGRENVFLNGAILGMSRAEIARKFEEIVAFAEIERFIDTPIKRYSTGMFMRLAFSVAAHLELEILLVDEVLAVGDAAFQKKCIGKMDSVAKQGRTILFVSHNMAAVRQLCNRTLVLADGFLLANENTDKAVDFYLSYPATSNEGLRKWDEDALIAKGKSVFPVSLCLKDKTNRITATTGFSDQATLDLLVKVLNPMTFQVSFVLINRFGVRIFSSEATCEPQRYQSGYYHFTAKLPIALLAPGQYQILLAIYYPNREFFFLDENALMWTIEETGSNLARYAGSDFGVIIVNLEWHIRPVLETVINTLPGNN